MEEAVPAIRLRKKEEVKAPAAVTVKAGTVEMTAQKLLGYDMKDKSPFFSDGIAYFNGDLIVGNKTEGNMTAYKLSKDRVEIDKTLFKDGVYAGQKGDSMKFPMAGGDGRLYFIDKELKSTDGKEVKKAFKYGYMWLAEGDTLYFAAQSVEKKGDTSHVAVAVTADGQLIRRYGAENRQDPSFMFMMDGLTVMPKYLVVAVSNGSFHVFDKADGKFLGKAKTEDMFGEEMKINGMAKVDENTFAIQYRTSKKDKDGNYGYALATITMK